MTNYQELAEAIKGDVAEILNGTPFNLVQDEIFKAVSLRICQTAAKDSGLEGRGVFMPFETIGVIEENVLKAFRESLVYAFECGRCNKEILNSSDTYWSCAGHIMDHKIRSIFAKVFVNPIKKGSELK